jgi:hypothetical protein
MPYTLFHEKFPALAEKETRTITTISDHGLPSDSYGLIESYCDESGCDCRRVFFNVISERQERILAVIAFGWENKKFYAKWMRDDDPQVISELQGPTLNLASTQSRFAPQLLELLNTVLQDKKYIERLKRHYKLFRESVEKSIQSNENENNITLVSFSPKIGRNMPCSCGSGKKYKKCCLTKTYS